MADQEKQPRKQVSNFVRYKIKQLSESNKESAVKATLAKLRRGIGKMPGSMPELWDVTLNGLPETLQGKGDSPTQGEWAVYIALTFYALHQQGKNIKNQCMCREKESLGVAVRKLVKSDEDEKRIKRRFDTVVTSDSMEELSHHLRGLIQLLKSENIALDYPALAEDLYRFQFSEARDSVRLKWGRDFYRIQNSEEKMIEQ